MKCDRCGWQAYLRAFKGENELDFCFHHGKEQAPGLERAGWRLQWDIEGLEGIHSGHKVAV